MFRLIQFYYKRYIHLPYFFLVLFSIPILNSIEFFHWKEVLEKHKIEIVQTFPTFYFSIEIAFLLVSLCFIISRIPFIKIISSFFLLVSGFLLFSNLVHFFQYGTYISKEEVDLFMSNQGEVLNMVGGGIGVTQFIFSTKFIVFFLFWTIYFSFVIYYPKLFFRNTSRSRIRRAGYLIAIFFLLCSIILVSKNYNEFLQKDPPAEAHQKGSPFYRIVYDIRNFILKKESNENSISGPSTYIDTREISGQNGNMVLIIMDSVRADHLPDYGYNRNTTPFISSLQKELIRIPTCYSQANGTDKSIPSAILSRYPTLHTRPSDWGLFKLLESKGYSAAIFSSMDLHWGGLLTMFSHPIVKKVFHAGNVPKKHHIWGFNLAATYNYGVDDGFTVEEVRKFIKDLPRPFFLVLHFHTTHYSYEVPEKYNIFKPIPKLPFRAAPPWTPMLNAYNNAIYRVDDAIREVFDIFKNENLLDTSAIAITADHGESFDEHPGSFYHLTSLYDSQVKVPLYFYVGSKLSAAKPMILKGKNRIVGLVDVMPTLFKATGNKLPSQFQGVPVWGTSKKSHETMVSFIIRPMQAVRKNQWKYIKNYTNNASMLFDLEKDPQEKTNLASKHPEIVKEMESLFRTKK